MKRRRALSREERALWQHAMRDVRRLDPPLATEPPPEARSQPVPAPAASAPAAKALPPPPLSPALAPGLDRRSALRLKRGQREIEARLDLHGMTQIEAHQALAAFVARAHAAEQRCVLVITGRSGILRATVPRWLNEAPNRARLLAFTSAQPKDGGAGALYLLLRRKR